METSFLIVEIFIALTIKNLTRDLTVCGLQGSYGTWKPGKLTNFGRSQEGHGTMGPDRGSSGH